MRGYAWAEQIADLRVAIRSQPALIPVLRPPESARAERWSHILSWYGLHPSPAHVGFAGREPPSRPADLIVALDEQSAALASVLAIADGRPLLQVPSIDALIADPLFPTARSLLLLGRPVQLRNRLLLDASARLRVPWGVLTARDAPALSFAIAKVLAARQQVTAPSGHLDAIAREQWRWPRSVEDDDATELDADAVQRAIEHAEWDTLSIHCHGDGAHANFNSVVLCGVAAAQESAFDGHPAGCTLDGSRTSCKRVHGPERRAFRFGDLRARRLCLFTCNGFSVAGDVYPSDASFVLSAAEGYPAAMLTTDRRLRFEPWLFPAAHATLEREPLGQVSHWLNDLCAFSESARPYVLYGDPASLDAPTATTCLEQSAGGDDVAIAPLGDLAASAAIGLDSEGTTGAIVRGQTVALVAGISAESSSRLVDRSDALRELECFVVDLGHRVSRARQLETAIRDYADVGLVTSASTQRAARDELTKVSDRLQYGVTEGTRLLAEMRRRGVWMREASAWRAHMRLLIDMWDQLLAELLLDDLLDRHPSDLLRDGFASHSRQPGSCCPRCGCVVIEGTASSLFVPDARHHWIECPTCGPREAWDGDGPRLRADAPTRITAGTRLEIRVDYSAPSGNRPLDGSDSGLLVVHLKDSGRGRVSFRTLERLDPIGMILTVPVPEDSSPEIHTLRLALVRSLTVSYLRLRTPSPAR